MCIAHTQTGYYDIPENTVRIKGLQFKPAVYGKSQSYGISLLKAASDGNAPGNPGDPDIQGAQDRCQIRSCGFALDIQVGGHYDLFNIFFPDPVKKLAYFKILGTYTSHGGQCSHENVVAAPELACSFYGEKVSGCLYHAKKAFNPVRIQTNIADLILRQVRAAVTMPYSILHLK